MDKHFGQHGEVEKPSPYDLYPGLKSMIGTSFRLRGHEPSSDVDYYIGGAETYVGEAVEIHRVMSGNTSPTIDVVEVASRCVSIFLSERHGEA